MKQLILLLLIIGTISPAEAAWFKKNRHKQPINKHVRRVQRRNKPGCFKSYSNKPFADHTGSDGFLHY